MSMTWAYSLSRKTRIDYTPGSDWHSLLLLHFRIVDRRLMTDHVLEGLLSLSPQMTYYIDYRLQALRHAIFFAPLLR